MSRFDDPWSLFIHTGKIEDYLSYRQSENRAGPLPPEAEGMAAPSAVKISERKADDAFVQ